MVKRDFYETEMVNEINDQIRFIKQVNVEHAMQCLGNARAALEFAVKLFWWKKYGIKIEKNAFGAPSNLYEATTDDRFEQYFNSVVLSDINVIRKEANDDLHGSSRRKTNDGGRGKVKLTLQEANELLRRLDACIYAIEKAIPMQILFNREESTSTIEPLQKTYQYTFEKKNKHTESKSNYSDVDERQKVFYDTFQAALDQNGNPFTFQARKGYGTINKRSANSDLCLGFDFWVPRKGFRINIYIRNDSQTRYFNRLLKHQEEIERELGFKPEWVDHGTRNPNTRRIQNIMYFNEYSVEDYEALLDETLPMIMKYLEVFSKYLPEAFSSDI